MLVRILTAVLCAGISAVSLLTARIAESRADKALSASRAASHFVGDGNPTHSFFALRARHDRLDRLALRSLITSAVAALAATALTIYTLVTF
ncbi:hypothetical protein [Nocardia rhizosphaerae]|uniref:Uncharacterized protein n=1 Tax=Nocardia rhizosphaerae TaxID=1691571 RepID=A0ABV8LDR6_9NOCA